MYIVNLMLEYIAILLSEVERSEVAFQMWSYKKVFWEYAANLQENTHAEVQYR